MKKLLRTAIFLLLLFNLPTSVFAFADAPVAVIVLDETGGDMDKRLPSVWREQVRRNFNFPDYKLIDQVELSKLLQGRMPNPERKSPYYQKSQLKYIADLTASELVFIIRVGQLHERMIRSRHPEGDTFIQTAVAIDATAYKKSTDQYLVKKIRFFETNAIGFSQRLENLAVYEVQDAIYYFYDQWNARQGETA